MFDSRFSPELEMRVELTGVSFVFLQQQVGEQTPWSIWSFLLRAPWW
jgi:hypothetical protein